MADVRRAALITAGAATAAFVADRATKVGVEHALDEGETRRGPLGIRFHRMTNDRATANPSSPLGAAVSLLGAGALAAGVAVGGTALRRPALLQIGAGMIAGGIVGNLVDRIGGDGVTDFISTPLGTINGADAAIGAGLLLGAAGLVFRR